MTHDTIIAALAAWTATAFAVALVFGRLMKWHSETIRCPLAGELTVGQLREWLVSSPRITDDTVVFVAVGNSYKSCNTLVGCRYGGGPALFLEHDEPAPVDPQW